jgi:hypothetical protein
VLLLAVVVLVLQAVLEVLLLVMPASLVMQVQQMLEDPLHGMCSVRDLLLFLITKLQVVGVGVLVLLVEMRQAGLAGAAVEQEQLDRQEQQDQRELREHLEQQDQLVQQAQQEMLVLLGHREHLELQGPQVQQVRQDLKEMQ